MTNNYASLEKYISVTDEILNLTNNFFYLFVDMYYISSCSFSSF